MIASLDMYNWPESKAAFDLFWSKIHNALTTHGISAPQDLTLLDENLHALADRAELLLGQVCGITYARANDEKHRYHALGSFIIEDDDLAPGEYCSLLITPKGRTPDLSAPQSLTTAINGYGSLSGWIVLSQFVSGQSQEDPFAQTLISGGHRQSAEMIARGEADLAAIDMISWKMLERFSPDVTAKIDILARTPARPGLPLVTSCHHPQEIIKALQAALDQAFKDPEVATALSALGITGLALHSDDEYRTLLAL